MARASVLSHLVREYCCPKCHNRTCHTEEVALPGGGASAITKVLGLGNGKYLVVICTLCGYSEMYNLRVLAKDQQRESATSRPKAAPSGPGVGRVVDD